MISVPIKKESDLFADSVLFLFPAAYNEGTTRRMF